MAVQKSRVTRSRRGMRRSHDALDASALNVNGTTGEVHRRHHITLTGYDRKGRQVVAEPHTHDHDHDHDHDHE